MKKTAAIAFIVSLLLYSCNQNKPTSQIPVVGEAVDSAGIAADTIQQKSLEESYEYAQTVVVSPKLVYDIRAYGGPPSHGEYCIIRRGADNKPDTVVQAERLGIIVNAFTADLNDNGEEEIYLVTRKTSSGSSGYISAFEFDKTGKAKALEFDNSKKINEPFPIDKILKNPDTVYTSGKLLLKSYSYNGNSADDKHAHAWRLKGNKFVPIIYDID